MVSLADAVDSAMELVIAPSFTRIGFDVRRRLDGWPAPSSADLTGRVIAVTGATSGLGQATAEQLARQGAGVIVIGRSADKAGRVVREIRRTTGNEEVHPVIADLADLGQVRGAAEEILDGHDRLDALVHNAGALDHQRREAPSGIEATIASQVVGPFLLTSLLLDRLAATPPGRVVTVSSGGMYAAELTVDHLEMAADDYDGTKQYALAKRAQVTLNELWAERIDPEAVVFHAMHPGWADTPGVAASLPTFRRVVGPLLRDPAQGADTIVWLAGDDGEPISSTGRFWLDRRPRPLHRLPRTTRSDTPERREALWSWVAEQAGVDAAPRA